MYPFRFEKPNNADKNTPKINENPQIHAKIHHKIDPIILWL